MSMYQVDVIERATNEVIDSVGPVATWKQAERVESGMNINMNHREYVTKIVEIETDFTGMGK